MVVGRIRWIGSQVFRFDSCLILFNEVEVIGHSKIWYFAKNQLLRILNIRFYWSRFNKQLVQC